MNSLNIIISIRCNVEEDHLDISYVLHEVEKEKKQKRKKLKNEIYVLTSFVILF